MKKIVLYIAYCLSIASLSAQTTVQKKKSAVEQDAFIHEAMELYDWSAIEARLGKDLKLLPQQVNDLLNFIFRSGDASMNTYLDLVEQGKIGKTNAQHYWEKQVPHFEALYTEKYLPSKKNRLNVLREGPGGHHSVLEGGANCNNLDFSNSTTSGWEGFWNDQGGIPGINQYGDLSVAGLNESGFTNWTGTVHELCTPGPADFIPIDRVPPGHSYSMRLGNDSAYRVLTSNGSPLPYNHQIVSNTFQVTEQNKAITYWYAVALSQYNPNNHSQFIQPYFRIRMYDQNSNEIVCAQYDVNALNAPQIGGFGTVSTSVPNGGGLLPYDLFYKDWSQVMIPLSDYVGQNVTITFETSDCAAGGHFGFAYVTVDCAPLPNITVHPIPCIGATGSLVGPPGAATYSWAGPGIVSGGNSQTVNVNAGGTYTVTMTTIGNSGFTCSFSVDTTIANPPPGPEANFTYAAVCAGVPTQFTDASNGNGGTITGWQWDFGDGTQSSQFNPTHTYAVGFGNTAVVHYTVTTSLGCTDTYSTTINLNQGSAAAFTTNTVCVGGSTAFTNTTPGTGNMYSWNFGDGSPTVANQNPVHIYPNAGTFQATLTVTTAQGCTNTTSGPVSVSAPPTANFTHSLACAGSPVNFTNTSSVLTGTYSWNFGDPSTTTDVSSVSNPSWQYNLAGTFTVSLNINAGNNCTANTTHTISVAPIPSATLTWSPIYCPGELIPSPPVQSNPASGVNYTWVNNNTQIGLGASGTGLPPAFTAAANNSGTIITGSFSVTPILNGCPGMQVIYPVAIRPAPAVIPPSIQLCPDETSPVINLSASLPGSSFNWTNTTANTFIGLSALQGTSTIPSFTTVNTTGISQSNMISATATAGGCTGNPVVFPITVHPYPVPAFTNTRACSGTLTDFFSQSGIGSGSITQWLWDFDNDGQYDDGANASASGLITPAGLHTVGLQVMSDKGCVAELSKQLYVNNTPYVDFEGDVLKGCPVHTVLFTDTTYIPLPEHIVGYSWNFGNLTSSTGTDSVIASYTNSSHTENAQYSVSLEVTSDSGCVGSALKLNYITVYPEPKADFGWGPTDVDVIDPTVYFDDLSVGASGTTPLIWHLGDTSIPDESNYTTLMNPVHTYPFVESDYHVTQWVSNSYGCKDSIVKTIHINGAVTFYIPNAFSPNRDQLNPGFKGTGIGINNNTYSLLVFDRWGMLIFESHDLEESWDGKFKEATVQNDVYVWKVNFEDYLGNGHQYAGTVTVVR